MCDPAAYDTCRASEVDASLSRWNNAQDDRLDIHDSNLLELEKAEARRAGAESMIKWVIGIVGVTFLATVAQLIVQLAVHR